MKPLWFIPVTAVLTIASKIPAAVAMSREGRGYDNSNPREQQSRLTGWGKRALAAHQNTLEAFPIFAACMLTGAACSADENQLAVCGGICILTRIIYIYLYISDQATLRSSVWAVGLLASLAAAGIGLLH